MTAKKPQAAKKERPRTDALPFRKFAEDPRVSRLDLARLAYSAMRRVARGSAAPYRT